MVGPRLETAPDEIGLAALDASCPKNWGYGGGWADFSDDDGGHRLCRKTEALDSWRLKVRWNMKKHYASEKEDGS